MPQSPNFPPSTTLAATAGTTTSTARRLSAADSISTGGGANKRSSLPPGFRPFGHHLQGQHGQYNASPLQRALTPPPPDALGPNDPEPFPSVESLESAGSGQNFHISGSGLPTSASSNDNTSPLQHHSYPYQPLTLVLNWQQIGSTGNLLRVLWSAVATQKCIRLYRMYLWRLQRLRWTDHQQSGGDCPTRIRTDAPRLPPLRSHGRALEEGESPLLATRPYLS